MLYGKTFKMTVGQLFPSFYDIRTVAAISSIVKTARNDEIAAEAV